MTNQHVDRLLKWTVPHRALVHQVAQIKLEVALVVHVVVVVVVVLQVLPPPLLEQPLLHQHARVPHSA